MEIITEKTSHADVQYTYNSLISSCWECIISSGMSVSFEGTREDFFSELMAWAADCGASCDGFEISNFADEGHGLKAARDIKVGFFLS